MNLKELKPPILELAQQQTLFRIQLTKARPSSVRLNGLLLAPPGLLTGRFCLPAGVTGYFADSPHTALYEAVFRREVPSCSLEMLRTRSLVTVHTTGSIRVADMRGLAEPYPFLQSKRMHLTQSLAAQMRASDIEGVLYESAQHSGHACLCFFDNGLAKAKRVAALPLVEPGTARLLHVVTEAARRSGVPLVGE